MKSFFNSHFFKSFLHGVILCAQTGTIGLFRISPYISPNEMDHRILTGSNNLILDQFLSEGCFLSTFKAVTERLKIVYPCYIFLLRSSYLWLIFIIPFSCVLTKWIYNINIFLPCINNSLLRTNKVLLLFPVSTAPLYEWLQKYGERNRGVRPRTEWHRDHDGFEKVQLCEIPGKSILICRRSTNFLVATSLFFFFWHTDRLVLPKWSVGIWQCSLLYFICESEIMTLIEQFRY